MIRKILKFFGYYKIEYGFSTGRHWIDIDGKEIYQGSGAFVNVPDDIVHKIGYYILDKGRYWSSPPLNEMYRSKVKVDSLIK